MAFNWFRRPNNTPEEQNQVKQEETKPAETKSAESTLETESSPAVSKQVQEDYLTWAKAAYKNIQEKQKQVETTSITETETVSEKVSEIGEAEKTETPINATEIEAKTEAEIEAKIEAKIEAEIEAEIEAKTEQDTAGEVLENKAETTPETTALPFWAKAEADREARLEKLRAEAIEEPEVIPTKTSSNSAIGTPAYRDGGLTFDESFLWSAEVLASQGRTPEDVSIEEITWLKRLRQGLDKTRRNLINQLKSIVGQGPLNQDAVSEIEALLLQADVGVEATDKIIQALQNKLKEEALEPEKAIAYLKQILRDILDAPLEKYSATFAPEKDTLNIWLMTGVNGAGKTTTIGKLARLGQKSGYKCLIAASDTFRAAAVEQVKIWGDRSSTEVIANPGKNTDPAAVVYDAIAAARSRGTELLLVDTAGRLQNKKNLMDELSKIRRIIDKQAADAKIESLLVLDATLGQNGLRQAEVFSQAAQLSGVVLTKLDGTAKGGVALAVVQQLGLPIRFIGAGEGLEDLRPFSSYEFVEALLNG